MHAVVMQPASRLVNAQLQAGERAFTEKACTLHGPKGAWHRAVTYLNIQYLTVIALC